MGQRSQIYVRYNKNNTQKGLIANYYGWNYGERMISRARWGIEFIKGYFEYISDPNYRWMRSPENKMHVSRIFDVNFDMKDVAISSDIVKELFDCYDLSVSSDFVKEELQKALDKETEVHGVEARTAEQEFIEYVFTMHHNNDGKLFVDIQDDGIKYCFLDCNANTDNIMDAAAYMIWNNIGCKEPDWTKSEYIKPEQKEKCRQNILAIAKMAILMTKEEAENFINYDYLGDMESIPF